MLQRFRRVVSVPVSACVCVSTGAGLTLRQTTATEMRSYQVILLHPNAECRRCRKTRESTDTAIVRLAQNITMPVTPVVVEATTLPTYKPDSGGPIRISEEEIDALYVCSVLFCSVLFM